MPGPERRSLRLANYDYASAGAYFITVCALDRRCLFGAVADDEMRTSALGKLVSTCWIQIPHHFPSVALDAFVVMPNHLHGILWLTRAGHAPPLHRVVGAFKSAASRAAGQHLWQRSFHDRVIRNDAELQLIRQYVIDNPLKWALDRENPGRLRPSAG
jgi:putative transposase